METLTVVTPCARPQNLPRIARAVGAQAPWELFDYTWLIVHDCLSGPCAGAGAPPHPAASMAHHADGASVAGHAQANYALDRIDRGLVWQLDDDNLPAPGFFAELARQAARHPGAGAYLFGQVAERRYDAALWAAHDGVVSPIPVLGKMDTAQYVVRREVVGPVRFALRYGADGLFIEDVVARAYPCVYVPGPWTLYNALRPAAR
jgi:hypothetical protein